MKLKTPEEFEAERAALAASHARLVEALEKTRQELQRIAERVSTQQGEAAMNCIGIALINADAALADAKKVQEAKHDNAI